MTDDEIETIKKLGEKIDQECLFDNVDAGCSAIDALAEFYDGPYLELVMKTLTQLLDICNVSDEIREHLYKTIRRLKQSDKIRSRFFKA